MSSDEQLMRAALRYGRRNLGLSSPNPSVACLIMQQEKIVGRGLTAKNGRPHAETIALQQAGEQARGATVYVTLEPCAHHGSTPPCAEALYDAGIARVVVAMRDPNPHVAGQGISLLRAAGIEVTEDVCAQEAMRDHAGHVCRITAKRPFVQLKLAQTRNHVVGRATERLMISSVQAQKFCQRLRTQTDAIAVGSGTVLADDPLLTCRLEGLAHRSPYRIVFDRRLRLPLSSRLVDSARDVPLTVLTTDTADPIKVSALKNAGVSVETITGLKSALECLSQQNITRLLVEGGAVLARSLLQDHLIDELILLESQEDYHGADAVMGLTAQEVDALAPSFKIHEDSFAGTDRLRRFWRH